MGWVQTVITLVSLLVAALTTISKILWSKEFQKAKAAELAAKDAIIAEKDIQIQSKDQQIEFWKSLAPKPLWEQMSSMQKIAEHSERRRALTERKLEEKTEELAALEQRLTTREREEIRKDHRSLWQNRQ